MKQLLLFLLLLIGARAQSWSYPLYAGDYISPRYAFAMSVWKERYLVVFAGIANGVTEQGDSNSTFLLDLVTLQWTEVHPTPADKVPQPRYFNAGAVVGDTFFTFGGGTCLNPDTSFYGDFWTLNLDTKTWEQALQVAISARQGHTMTAVANQIFLFGGTTFNANTIPTLNIFMNDGYFIDSTTFAVQAIAPGPYIAYHSTVWYQDRMISFGGWTFGKLGGIGELWYFFPSNDSWVLGNNATNAPARYGQVAAMTSTGLMLMFGGIDGNSATLSDLWTFNVTASIWSQIGGSTIGVDSPCGAFVLGALVVFGGDLDVGQENPGNPTGAIQLFGTLNTSSILGNNSTNNAIVTAASGANLNNGQNSAIKPTVVVAIAVPLGVVTCCGLLFCVIFTTVLFRRQRRKEKKNDGEGNYFDLYTSMPHSSPNTARPTTSAIRPTTSAIHSATSVQNLVDVKVEALLGDGNFGDVYRGSYNGTPVAMKCLKETSFDNFEKECATLAKLQHPNVVQFLGVHISPKDGSRFMVFEFMEGGSLVQFLIENRGLSLSKRVDFMRDGARGMAYLESKGVIHRDIACRNFLVDLANRVKISDFGMARENYYSTSQAAMPIKWTAPEVLLQAPCTSKSDAYSFGVFMWEVCEEGKQPWLTLSNAEVVPLVTDQRRVLDKPKDCVPELYNLMLRCWSFSPAGRPTFKEILDVLDSLCLSFSAQKLPLIEDNYVKIVSE